MGLKIFFRINPISFHIEGANAEENCDLRAGNSGGMGAMVGIYGRAGHRSNIFFIIIIIY